MAFESERHVCDMAISKHDQQNRQTSKHLLSGFIIDLHFCDADSCRACFRPLHSALIDFFTVVRANFSAALAQRTLQLTELRFLWGEQGSLIPCSTSS